MIEFEVKHFQTVASTNTYLKELSKQAHIPEGTVILADNQSGGRGRGINSWISERAKNLTFSLLVRPDLPVSHHFSLVEFVSLAVTDTLCHYRIDARIKWPNDIYAGDDKIAGILIENIISGNTISSSVAGIGLNVNQTRFAGGLPNPVSMKLILGRPLKRKPLVEFLLEQLQYRYEQIRSGLFRQLHEEYSNKIYKKDESIRYYRDGRLMEGILRRIADTGELFIEDKGGRLTGYLFGEIQFAIV